MLFGMVAGKVRELGFSQKARSSEVRVQTVCQISMV
jgi:hypothetical protein